MMGAWVKQLMIGTLLVVSGWAARVVADPDPLSPPVPLRGPDEDDSEDTVMPPGDNKLGTVPPQPPPPSRPGVDDGDMIEPEGLAPITGARPGAGKPAPRGAEGVAEGRDLVNMDFPELTEIKDIIKAVALWTGKNVILDRNVTGKIQIISPKKVTKEEAYMSFLSALNMLNLTTVETGKVIKIMKIRNAVRGNLKTYHGPSWAPRTDEIITQIIPLKYVDARQIQNTLSRIVSPNSMIAYEPTNTLIVSDSGYKVRRVLEILDLIDVQTQQPKVLIVPIKYADPAGVSKKINELLKPGTGGARAQGRSSYLSYKIMLDERSNSIIIFGPPRTIKDIRDLVKKFDTKIDDPQSQATIHVRPLDYADAKKLATTLSSLAAGSKNAGGGVRRPPTQISPSGGDAPATVASLGNDVKITADEASNSLLITGSRNAYDSLNTLIRKLDTRRPQVYIKAEIFDLNNDNDLKLGTSIFAGFQTAGSKGIIGWEAGGMAPLVIAQSQIGTAGANTQAAAAQVANAFKTDVTIGVLSGTEVEIPGLGKLTPGGLINLMKVDKNTRTLSSPSVLTTNNEEATVTVGDTLFFKSAQKDAQGVVSNEVKKEPVDLTLTIKPNISHSNYLTLKINLDANSVASLTEDNIPRVSKRKTSQIVTVKNGQTIIVSGLMKTFESEVYKKIPLFGDIPIIGWLFRNSQISSSNSNLVIFITSHIIHGAADLAAIYQKQVEDRDQMIKTVYGSRFKNDSFYKQLPSPEDGRYINTPQDDREEKSLEKLRKEGHEAMGYGGESAAKSRPAVEPKEEEFTVPGELGSGGAGGGSIDAPPPPPPPEDFPDEGGGGGED